MTGKERMLAAMTNGIPDRVPAAPDFSNMVPCRLTGKKFWDIYLHGDPQIWQAYMDAARYFGTDAWFIYGQLNFKTNSQMQLKGNIISQNNERIVQELIYSTPAGDMRSEITYFIADPPTMNEKPIKDIAKDFEKVKYLYDDLLDYDNTILEAQRATVGDTGALGISIGYPGFQMWFSYVNGGIEDLTYAYYDNPEIIQEWLELEHKRSIRMMEFAIDAKPDFILLGGSGSITLQSPEMFKEFGLPTIKAATRMAKEAGVPTMLHSCGKERALVEMVANETDLNCVNPLEVPPMGDCDLAEIKKSFGDKIALMGNLHTTEVMLKGTPEDVEKAAIKAIEDAGANGGFILSTGDQCGRDTPDENIFKLVEVVEKYGRY